MLSGLPNNPQLGSPKNPTLLNEGGVVMSRMFEGDRRTIASLALWAEESRMVGRELWEELHRARSR